MSRTPALLSREPIALSFCGLSLLVLIAAISSPEKLSGLLLIPPYAVEKGHVWQFATYAFFPVSVASFIIVSALLLWFGWHLEPVLRPFRSAVLYLGAALASGIAYAFLAPSPPVALGGGLFVVSGAASAFLIWSIPSRRKLGWKLKIFWCLVAIWVAFVLFASPLYLVVMHLLAWGVGVLLLLHRLARSPPNNALQVTPQRGAPER
jgi:membrane associated rhomboid family serine protease